jgi:hypothetical protein
MRTVAYALAVAKETIVGNANDLRQTRIGERIAPGQKKPRWCAAGL